MGRLVRHFVPSVATADVTCLRALVLGQCEKVLPSKESTSPELLTVMIKREAGFNSDNGDWEYMSLDGTGSEVQVRGHKTHKNWLLWLNKKCHKLNQAKWSFEYSPLRR